MPSPEDLRIANHRYRILEPYLQSKPPEQAIVSARTLRRWKHQFRAAQQLYNWGYIGLLPHQSAKGNHAARVNPDAWAFIDQVIEEHYETVQQKGKLGSVRHSRSGMGAGKSLRFLALVMSPSTAT